jgi:hypothetical protein
MPGRRRLLGVTSTWNGRARGWGSRPWADSVVSCHKCSSGSGAAQEDSTGSHSGSSGCRQSAQGRESAPVYPAPPTCSRKLAISLAGKTPRGARTCACWRAWKLPAPALRRRARHAGRRPRHRRLCSARRLGRPCSRRCPPSAFRASLHASSPNACLPDDVGPIRTLVSSSAEAGASAQLRAHAWA